MATFEKEADIIWPDISISAICQVGKGSNTGENSRQCCTISLQRRNIPSVDLNARQAMLRNHLFARTGLGSPGHETPSGVEDGVLIRDLT
jgi:hypothetical protein